jgi:hypothetical protein
MPFGFEAKAWEEFDASTFAVSRPSDPRRRGKPSRRIKGGRLKGWDNCPAFPG